MKIWLAILMIAVTMPMSSEAHDPGLSTATLRVEADQIVLELAFAPEDLVLLKDGNSGTSPLDYYSLAARAVGWTSASGTTTPAARQIDVQPNDVVFKYVLPKASAEFQSRLIAELPFGHRQWFVERGADDSMLRSEMLSAKSPAPRISIESLTPGSVQPTATIGAFFLLGIEHIITGYDHLLFLVSLLIVCQRLWPAAQIITCFTLAHSLTLAAAAFGWLRVPSAIVEPVIAGTIVYVALENLFAQRSIRWRCVMTVTFGLVHGLGFGSVLQELDVAKDQMLPALLGFNLGVESGQLGLAALVLPLWLRWQRSSCYWRPAIPAVSVAIAVLGLLWLFQRTVFATN